MDYALLPDLNLPFASVWIYIANSGLAAFSGAVSVVVILRSRGESTVIHIDARCTAMVFLVNEHPARDRPINPLPRVTMRVDISTCNSDPSIPFTYFGAGPNEAVALPLSA